MPSSSKSSPKKSTTSSKNPRRKTTRRSSNSKRKTLSSPSPTTPFIDYDVLKRSLITPPEMGKNETIEYPNTIPSSYQMETETVQNNATLPHTSFDYTHELIPTVRPKPVQRLKLWSGVLIFLLIISFFWIWNLKLHVTNLTFAASSDQSLLSKTQETWQQAFADTPTSSPIDTQKISSVIGALLATSTSSTISADTTSSLGLSVTTSTATSTIESPVTSTIPVVIPTSTTSTIKKVLETLPPSKKRKR